MPPTNPSALHPNPSAAAWPYNSELSLWLSVDPLSDKYPGVSPYVYCANNPVVMKDPDGRTFYEVDGERKHINDGHDNITVAHITQKQFNKLQRSFEHNHTYRYNRLNNRFKTHNGYTETLIVGEDYTNESGVTTLAGIQCKWHQGTPTVGKRIANFANNLDHLCRGHADNSRWEGHGDYWDRQFAKRAEPYVTAAVSIMPGISQINDVMTIKGEDMFGNSATTTDKVVAGISLVTVGTAKIPIRAVQSTSKWCGWGTRFYTAGNTWKNERKKNYR